MGDKFVYILITIVAKIMELFTLHIEAILECIEWTSQYDKETNVFINKTQLVAIKDCIKLCLKYCQLCYCSV